MSHTMKKHLIYKHDKWNMMTVEVRGKTIVLREISDQWGEECHTFLSRPEMMNWVQSRFPEQPLANDEERQQWRQLMDKFKQI